MSRPLRIVLSGGGTGGHIYPALALARYIEKKRPGTQFLYIGSERGLEKNIVPKTGMAFEMVKIQGLKRSLSLENFKTLWYMIKSTAKAKKLLKEFKPDVVIGTGGYVCGPVLLAASQLHYPSIIHEQNSVAGITNKFLSRFVSRIAICFEDVAKDFGSCKDKLVYTGNPRGQEVIEQIKDSLDHQGDKKEVLIFGGSQGAEAINTAFLEAYKELAKRNYRVTLVTGKKLYDQVKVNLTEDLRDNIELLPYIDDMPEKLARCNLIVCRAGATTLTEITALGLPSILIPSPYVTGNHQEHNALSLAEKGAAVLIRESDLTGELLLKEMDSILNDPVCEKMMAQAAYDMGVRNASERILELIEGLL
ncbi:undecaprenyldiphospho-muramoylpentapeptide beta-N-acetylglucosaminyltransferase [Atopobacter sp. AH10]|uniref:undecaprenyldiphospho-muramoylpentapeptide beta-N-acetylglucosaminyltransferase n=1 Tax=Atopobacter sp. AH10 TaxID=2315861 RepID=UPI000EF281C1|nr:undecaprenyldiphospho-muramoylpentapeptide beta-N-acetylglucosaminyltransferase [Atopobacter sp. AH10]RLK62944.1 undecaprenyldiphospho-muramoylpentapeptide beta-N-acetylglucosaminyltransferase [Atopobacter sp. AH10]